MGPLVRDRSNPRSLVANFDAFKFPTSEVTLLVDIFNCILVAKNIQLFSIL